MPDDVLIRDGPVAVPLSYTVPQSGEMLPLMVRATVDGTAAAGPFYATVQVVAPSGRVMGSAISSSIAAGASADVTWFPNPIAAAAAASSGHGLTVLYDSGSIQAAASIDTGAGGIAGGHGDLIVLMLLRSAANALTDTALIRFNNDSAANYDSIRVQGTAATTTTATGLGATSLLETIHGNSGTTTVNYATALRIDIPSYDATTFFKVATLQAATIDAAASANDFVTVRGSGWRSLPAITRMAVTTNSGSNLMSGCRMVVYGAQ